MCNVIITCSKRFQEKSEKSVADAVPFCESQAIHQEVDRDASFNLVTSRSCETI